MIYFKCYSLYFNEAPGDNQPVANNGVAFFAYLSKNEPNPGAHQTFVFDVDHTNIGGHYSHHTGVFTCPRHGVYVFSWCLFCSAGGFVFSELVVNSSPVLGKYVGAQGVSNLLSSTDLVIVDLNPGDEVYIRTAPNQSQLGQVISEPPYRSTFSGWKLF
uniref:C1q domain-containing protein n=1 Tax=Magallana gigas TaxID=29159 RepID=A0A8W8NXP6_MAGGI